MQANRFTAPLRIIPRLSTPCTLALLGVHGLAAIALLLTSQIAWVSVALGMGIMSSAVLTWRELRAPAKFEAFLYDSAGRWSATTVQGERYDATVAGFPLIMPWLVVIPLVVAKRHYTLLVAADVTPPDIVRRLQIRLRYALSTPATISAAE